MTTVIDAVRQGWRLLIVAVVAGASLGAAVTVNQTPLYEAKVRLFVALLARPSEALEDYVDSKAVTYAALVSSDQLGRLVARSAQLPLSGHRIGAEIHGEVDQRSAVIDVSVHDPSHARALTIARAVGVQFPAMVQKLDYSASPTPLLALRVVTPAHVSAQPTSPDRPADVSTGALGGLVVGLLLIGLRRRLNSRVNDAVLAEVLGDIPVLVELPADDRPDRRAWHAIATGTDRGEAMRRLRTNLEFLTAALPVPVVTVTSPVGAEGTTTVALDLATAYANAGHRVVLVDVNLRPHPIAWPFNATGPGLYDMLLAGVNATEALHLMQRPANAEATDTVGSVRVLHSGAPRAGGTASLALAGAGIERVLRELARSSDLVLIDAPPVLQVSDAASLSARLGGVMLVVADGVTTRNQLRDALEAFRIVGSRVLGAVLNFAPPSETGAGAYAAGTTAAPAGAGRAGRGR